jgi:hypothetical protein
VVVFRFLGAAAAQAGLGIGAQAFGFDHVGARATDAGGRRSGHAAKDRPQGGLGEDFGPFSSVIKIVQPILLAHLVARQWQALDCEENEEFVSVGHGPATIGGYITHRRMSAARRLRDSSSKFVTEPSLEDFHPRV